MPIALSSPVTATGVNLWVGVPSPNCPKKLYPQASALPGACARAFGELRVEKATNARADKIAERAGFSVALMKVSFWGDQRFQIFFDTFCSLFRNTRRLPMVRATIETGVGKLFRMGEMIPPCHASGFRRFSFPST